MLTPKPLVTSGVMVTFLNPLPFWKSLHFKAKSTNRESPWPTTRSLRSIWGSTVSSVWVSHCVVSFTPSWTFSIVAASEMCLVFESIVETEKANSEFCRGPHPWVRTMTTSNVCWGLNYWLNKIRILTVGVNFKQASNFLWPFKLSNPTGGFRTRKFKHFVEGGDLGNREEKINQLVQQMN